MINGEPHEQCYARKPGANQGGKMKPFLSVIVPIYNEELVVAEMYKRVTEVLDRNQLDYELVIVNDGSDDRSLEIAKELARKDGRVKVISFSRNFGHQVAITAGMDSACGQVVVIIDADLQDPPEVIIDMVEKWRQGYHVVYGIRKARNGETWFKLVTAAMFYRLLRVMTPVDIPPDTGDFRLMDRKVVEEIKQMREKSRFVRGMVSWVGFRQGKVEYTRDSRFRGQTKYPFKKMLKFAIDGMLSFSDVPLKLSTTFGFACALVSFVFMMYGLVVKWFYPETAIHGWASIFVGSLFIGGVQLICIGILGEYVGRIYEEVKRRPLYIVEKETELPAEQSIQPVLTTYSQELDASTGT